MQHDFTGHEVSKLIDLKTDLQGTLHNRRCEILTTPTMDTINQIDAELLKRGLGPIKTEKHECIRIQAKA